MILHSNSPSRVLILLLVLSLLLFFQVSFAYAFMDAAQGEFAMRFLPGFLDGLDMSVWYSNSIVANTFAPVLWYIPSTLSLLLLAIVARRPWESNQRLYQRIC